MPGALHYRREHQAPTTEWMTGGHIRLYGDATHSVATLYIFIIRKYIKSVAARVLLKAHNNIYFLQPSEATKMILREGSRCTIVLVSVA